jgi:UDP-N-acetylmuramoyl-L-alanyl-D-glutamate--2,6-diaminopimelate ligase
VKSFIDILPFLTVLETKGDLRKLCSHIAFDSRKVIPNTAFIAVIGTQNDGHQFIEKAIERGATMIICQTLPNAIAENVAYIVVKDSAASLGKVASWFYDEPSKQLKLVGVTGTNGKTTTVTLLHNLFTALGYKTGLLSTVENRIGTTIVSATHTTPDAVSLNALLREMVNSGCEYAFMEVSSHAVVQHRVTGLHFIGGIFTNITHDHLDYHKTLKEYINAKKGFFDALPKTAFALTNTDDRRGNVMLQNTKAKKYTYSIRKMADFKAKIVENAISGLHLDINGHEYHGRLIGEFNAYNTLAVFGTAVLLGVPINEVLTVLSNMHGAEGRFDQITDTKRNITAIVDYAHTPDALEKVLQTIAHFQKGSERVITVVGCGGDRDKTKRPIMAEMACKLSDIVILTADNPRSEAPEAILKEMEVGISVTQKKKVLIIANREQAIRTACQLAQNGDIVLVAGKGHEKYQEIKGVKHAFDDKQIIKDIFFN